MRSVNQNHHLYVVKDVVSSGSDFTDSQLLPGSGAIKVVTSGANPMEKDIYFQYVGNDGLVRSDLIPLNQITYVKYVPASTQRTPLRKIEVSLDSNINSGAPVTGQDYVLNIAFQQFYGLSPEDTYVKTVAVHVTSAISTAGDLVDAMIDALNASFSREVGATATTNPYLTFTKSSSKLVIEEKEQPWSLGKWESESLVFDVFPSTITVSNDEVEWGTASVVASTSFVNNSKKMADLEWFTFGERADYYRGMGYPNNFEFRPMVDPSNANGYDALEIHFAYQGTCEDIQKSEKDITLIGSAANIASVGAILGGSDMLGGLPNNKVATPVITFGADNKATITCATPGATIKYGNASAADSVTMSSTGTAPVTTAAITANYYVKAQAIVPGMADSEIATAKNA